MTHDTPLLSTRNGHTYCQDHRRARNGLANAQPSASPCHSKAERSAKPRFGSSLRAQWLQAGCSFCGHCPRRRQSCGSCRLNVVLGTGPSWPSPAVSTICCARAQVIRTTPRSTVRLKHWSYAHFPSSGLAQASPNCLIATKMVYPKSLKSRNSASKCFTQTQNPFKAKGWTELRPTSLATD